MKNLYNIHKHRGFSLIEMSMVMVILALLLGGLFAAVGDSTNNLRRSSTNTLLRQVEEALYGFAQANGRLPCPATNADASENCLSGRNHGFIPSATLGLSGATDANGLLLDAWQNPLRYSVHPAFTDTDVSQVSNLFENWSTAGTGLRICNNAACTNPDQLIAEQVPATVLSLGANWANFNAGDFSSADEVANAGGEMLGEYWISSIDIGTEAFVSRPYNDADFDDQIIWLSPHIPFSRMVRAGRLR